MIEPGLKREFASMVGLEFAHDDPASLWIYSRDASPLPPSAPDLVLRPDGTEQVAAVLRLANERRIPVYPRSSGSNLWGGSIPTRGGIVLDLGRMNRVLSIDPELFSCTVQPAVSFARLTGELANYGEGYYNLVSPEGAYSSCIGGSFMAHGDGIGSGLWGTQGDAVIGCKVVLPTGEVVTTGSAANPAAVETAGGSGQFFRYSFAHDLTGLFCGSEGTLGVLVEATTRIERLPEKYGFAAFNLPSVGAACDVLYEARLARIPANFAALREGKSLAAVAPGNHPEAQLVYILEGDEPVVEHYLERLLGLVARHGGEEVDPGIASRYWERRFSLVPGGMYKLGARALLPLHYPLGRLKWYYQRILSICEELIAGRYGLAYFIGGFQINSAFVCYPTIMYLDQYPEQYEAVSRCAAEAQKLLLDLGGAPIQIGRLWTGAMGRLGSHYELIKTIKRAVDPNGIMSPGVLDI